MVEKSNDSSVPETPTLVLAPWNGTWATDDPDANFKEEVVAYGLLDPLETLDGLSKSCLLYTSPSPRDGLLSRMPSSA